MKSFFWVMNGKKLKQIVMLTAALLFAAGIIYTERENVSVFSAQNEPAAIYSVQTNKKLVALTFDISWGEKRTSPILKVLENKKVKKATFFLSSPWAQSHPDLVNQIVKAGYEVGSHGHKHTNYSELNDDEIRSQLRKAHHILSDITGKSPNLLRLPNGDFDKRVLQIAAQMNYRVIQWDTDSHDWKNPGVDAIVERVVSKAHKGDIILLHASDSVKQTHEALPKIIDRLRGMGYDFTTVSELIEQSTITNKQLEEQTMNMKPML